MSDQSKFPGNMILTVIILVIAAAAFINTTKTILEDGQSTRAQIIMLGDTVNALQQQVTEIQNTVKATAAAAAAASQTAAAPAPREAAKK